MAAGDQRLGALILRSPDHAYTEADERLLTSIADIAALALRSARLYGEATRAHAELAAAQDQLVRTEKLRAMGQMASGMAHDFNNVMSAILGRAQLLLARVEDPALRQWLLVIERAATDGARTVRRLQDFTRVRRDQPAEPVDLNRVVEETLEATELSWRQELLRRGIAIEVETALAPSRPVVSGDSAELREALTNVILNAVDAMPEGGRLRVETRPVGGGVELSVADTGTGIAAGIRERIFDPFFTTKGPKGTGLGLSMTYGILARHDGRITVESEEGAGTTFRIAFPVTGEALAAPDPVAPLSPAPVALRCLVVDDESAVAEVLSDMLAAIGHDAIIASTGAEALVRLRAGPFDLVLTDLAMPAMTGWELAAAAKALVPGLPVVLVTGVGVEASPADLASRGVDLVLAKPLQIRDLRSAIIQVVPRAGGQS
jgi:signal transduction histidine kinase/CheY-like chemotaxis protein